MYTEAGVIFCHPWASYVGGGAANSRAKINLKVTYDYSSNKGRNKCITSFWCNFDRKIYSYMIFMIQSDFQSQFQGQIYTQKI